MSGLRDSFYLHDVKAQLSRANMAGMSGCTLDLSVPASISRQLAFAFAGVLTNLTVLSAHCKDRRPCKSSATKTHPFQSWQQAIWLESTSVQNRNGMWDLAIFIASAPRQLVRACRALEHDFSVLEIVLGVRTLLWNRPEV